MPEGSTPGSAATGIDQGLRPQDITATFAGVPLNDFLDADTRPTFVIEFGRVSQRREVVFINRALRIHTFLLNEINAESSDLRRSFFREWIDRVDEHGGEDSWRGYLWRRTPVHERWLIFQGTDARDPDEVVRSPSTNPRANSFQSIPMPSISSMTVSTPSLDPTNSDQTTQGDFHPPVIDWTRPSVEAPTPYVKFFKAFDWSKTPLGPINYWPQQLRTVCNTILADSDPGLILWGPQMSMLYNQAAVEVIGRKHPAALGRHPSEAFGELWSAIEDLIQKVKITGKSTKQQSLYLPMNRKGFSEETYWNFTILPIIGTGGSAVGAYDRFVEATGRVILERRMSTLVQVGDLTSSTPDLTNLYGKLLSILESNPKDNSFAAIYTVVNAEEPEHMSVSSDSTTSISSKICILGEQIGLLPGCNELPAEFPLSDRSEPLAEQLVQAWRSNKPLLLKKSEGTLPEYLSVQNPERCFGDKCGLAVVMPVRFALEHMLAGFVIIGLNERRPLDEDYLGYLSLLHRRIVDATASVIVPVEENRKNLIREEESLRQASLATKLLTRTHEAEMKQSRFARLAEKAPIGMGLYDSNSNPIFFNDAYFEMTGQVRGTFSPFTWLDYIHEDDLERVVTEWRKLTEHRMPVTIQHRVKKPWLSTNKADGTEISGETWLLASAFPELTGDDPDAPPALIMGWTIDISYEKWAESLQKQRLEDALETKRQSENFIDMTSHEMRNPLSAILQSADGICTLIATHQADDTATKESELLNALSENSQTIILCAQHQKRIVDDILTLSKLDSNLLQITPDQVDPLGLVHHVIKMYETELTSQDIAYSVVVEESYKKLWPAKVLVDPSRLLQVLINLTTNAIKFTQRQTLRKITLSVDASLSRPSVGPHGATFVPANKNRRQAATPQPENSGEPIYLTFAVHDTGRGLSKDESKLLFQRFSQVSPRTHVQYGGSGLGLFISRELTEVQDGQIGVASELDKGSTFAFYVKSYRCLPSATGSDGTNDVAAIAFTSIPVKRDKSSVVPIPELHSVRGSSILVVEDNIINQKVMVNQLKGLGCKVYVANHGVEALEFLRTSTFASEPPSKRREAGQRGSLTPLDVVLMDVEMPVMDGLTCVRKIRELQETGDFVAHVPVICITANAREAQVAQAKAQGCDLVVTKPFRIPELIPQMRKLVESSRSMA